MNIEDSIKAAIEYETSVCELYRQAQEEIREETTSRLVKALHRDEQFHVQYLKHKLKEYQEDGRIKQDEIKSALPSREEIDREINRLKTNMNERILGDKKKVLAKILKAETETSKFYRQMVETLPDEGKALFSRFLEIEDAHIALVQAELDYYSNTGFWFDNKEVDMEWIDEG